MQTASSTPIKCLLNSTLSTDGAKFMIPDIGDYCYGTKTLIFEYTRMSLKDIPDKIIAQYKQLEMSRDGWAYMQIEKGMSGLKQAGKIANDRLKTHKSKYGYTPVPRTPALWTHETRPTTFTLVVDGFGIKHETIQDAKNLLNALKDLYAITIDWSG